MGIVFYFFFILPFSVFFVATRKQRLFLLSTKKEILGNLSFAFIFFKKTKCLYWFLRVFYFLNLKKKLKQGKVRIRLVVKEFSLVKNLDKKKSLKSIIF